MVARTCRFSRLQRLAPEALSRRPRAPNVLSRWPCAGTREGHRLPHRSSNLLPPRRGTAAHLRLDVVALQRVLLQSRQPQRPPAVPTWLLRLAHRPSRCAASRASTSGRVAAGQRTFRAPKMWSRWPEELASRQYPPACHPGSMAFLARSEASGGARTRARHSRRRDGAIHGVSHPGSVADIE